MDNTSFEQPQEMIMLKDAACGNTALHQVFHGSTKPAGHIHHISNMLV